MPSSNTTPRGESQRLLGEIEQLLNHQFLLVACKGGLLKDASPALMADFAIASAKGGVGHLPSVDAVICHDALCALVREGHALNRAVALARRSPAAEAAFGREQARDLAELDGRMRTERGGA